MTKHTFIYETSQLTDGRWVSYRVINGIKANFAMHGETEHGALRASLSFDHLYLSKQEGVSDDHIINEFVTDTYTRMLPLMDANKSSQLIVPISAPDGTPFMVAMARGDKAIEMVKAAGMSEHSWGNDPTMPTSDTLTSKRYDHSVVVSRHGDHFHSVADGSIKASGKTEQEAHCNGIRAMLSEEEKNDNRTDRDHVLDVICYAYMKLGDMLIKSGCSIIVKPTSFSSDKVCFMFGRGPAVELMLGMAQSMAEIPGAYTAKADKDGMVPDINVVAPDDNDGKLVN